MKKLSTVQNVEVSKI